MSYSKMKVEEEKIKAEELQEEIDYKIENFDSVANKLAIADLYRLTNENYKEVLGRVLDIISADSRTELDDLARLPEEVMVALRKNKNKYKRRYK